MKKGYLLIKSILLKKKIIDFIQQNDMNDIEFIYYII